MKQSNKQTGCSMCYAQERGVFVPPHIHSPLPSTPGEKGWEERWDNFKVEEYGKWKIDRNVAKEFIRQEIDAAKGEERERIVNVIGDKAGMKYPHNSPEANALWKLLEHPLLRK